MFTYRVALAALLCAGCGPSVSFVRTGPVRGPLAAAEDVRVYLTHRPEAAYQEIGVAEVRGGTLETRVQAAVKLARTHGGNAVILIGSHAETGTYTGTQRTTATVVQPGVTNQTVHVDAPVTQVYTYDVDRYVIASVSVAER